MSILPESWTSANVLELSKMVRGVTYSRNDAHDKPVNGLVAVLRANNITERGLVFDNLVYVPRKFVNDDQKINSGDVIVATSSGSISVVGKAKQARTDVDAGFGTFCALLRPISGIEPRYFGHFFGTEYYRSTVSSLARGININNLKGIHFRQIDIPFPPFNEQKRIADKLDTLLAHVDSCQAHLERVPQILKQLRQSILAAAMSGRLTKEWRGENQIEDDWQETDVQSVATVGTGSTPLRSNLRFYFNLGTPWVTSAATGQPFITSAQEFVTDEAIKANRLKLFPVGTLIVGMYGEGKTRGQVSELKIEATINQACAAIVVDETKVEKNYLKLALQANYLEMREMAEGGNQPNLNLTKIKEFRFPLPSMDEQHGIVRRVESLFAFVDRLEARYQAGEALVARLTPSLLAKAFSGELVEQDPNDEPAGELLERIRAAREAADAISPRNFPNKKRDRIKIEVNMLKRSEIEANHLSSILKERGALTAESLWSASQLDIDEFYDQLKDEEVAKLLREVRASDPKAPRLLEAL